MVADSVWNAAPRGCRHGDTVSRVSRMSDSTSFSVKFKGETDVAAPRGRLDWQDIPPRIVQSVAAESTGEVYNVGRGLPVDLIDAVKTIRRVTGTPEGNKPSTPSRKDARVFGAYTPRATRASGYPPGVYLANGLAIQWTRRCGHPVTDEAARPDGLGTCPALRVGKPL